jgi:hypothetical protein
VGQKVVQRRRAPGTDDELITDQELCRFMGEAGRAKAEREFGLDRLVADSLAAYRAAGWEEKGRLLI